MSDEPPSLTCLDEILAHAHHLLIDVDGTLCSLFAGAETAHIADRLRKAARPDRQLTLDILEAHPRNWCPPPTSGDP